jgi:hypothetical protein
MPKARLHTTSNRASERTGEAYMSLKNKILSILVAEGHDEPVGQVDRMNGVGVEVREGDR